MNTLTMSTEERESINRVLAVLHHEAEHGTSSDGVWMLWAEELRDLLTDAGHDDHAQCVRRTHRDNARTGTLERQSMERVLVVMNQEAENPTPMADAWADYAGGVRDMLDGAVIHHGDLLMRGAVPAEWSALVRLEDGCTEGMADGSVTQLVTMRVHDGRGGELPRACVDLRPEQARNIADELRRIADQADRTRAKT